MSDAKILIYFLTKLAKNVLFWFMPDYRWKCSFVWYKIPFSLQTIFISFNIYSKHTSGNTEARKQAEECATPG